MFANSCKVWQNTSFENAWNVRKGIGQSLKIKHHGQIRLIGLQFIRVQTGARFRCRSRPNSDILMSWQLKSQRASSVSLCTTSCVHRLESTYHRQFCEFLSDEIWKCTRNDWFHQVASHPELDDTHNGLGCSSKIYRSFVSRECN